MPPTWPQPHPYAEDFDEFWIVHDLPPLPWPEEPSGGWTLQEIGPEGTEWLFSVSSYLNRLSWPGFSQGFQQTLRVLTDEAQSVTLPFSTTWGWRSPGPLEHAPREGPRMRWIHCTIIGTLPSNESVAHTFNFRTAPVLDVDQDAPAVLTFANQVRDAWVAFLSGPINTKGKLSTDLVYTEVGATYLEQTVPATITTVPGKRGPKKLFHPPRPGVLVPTQYSAFPANTKGIGASGDLPFEVANAVTLTTGVRGSRNRGRVYLGPLDRSIMSSGGNFDAAAVHGIALDLGNLFVHTLNTTTGNRLHVVSRSYATSIPVTGTAGGVVPDSQRRRRKNLPEGSAVGWTGP